MMALLRACLCWCGAGGCLLLLSAVAGCGSTPRTLTLRGEAMGTQFSIVAAHVPGRIDEAALRAAIDDTLTRIDTHLSNWNPDSEISRFNASRGAAAMVMSTELADVMAVAREVHAASGGYFDVTLGPLIDAWGFGSAAAVVRDVPADAEIARAAALVGQNRMLSFADDPPVMAKRRPEVIVSLAALAKGYGIDALAASLRRLGIDDFMVEIGGDLYASGRHPSGRPWRIGVERPGDPRRSVLMPLTVSGAGVATSGDYRQYFERDGVRYSHILDPTTGRPITHDTASVTVLAPTAVAADAWATALMAMGAADGLALAERLSLAALFVQRDAAAPGGFSSSASTALETSLSAMLPRPEED